MLAPLSAPLESPNRRLPWLGAPRPLREMPLGYFLVLLGWVLALFGLWGLWFFLHPEDALVTLLEWRYAAEISGEGALPSGVSGQEVQQTLRELRGRLRFGQVDRETRAQLLRVLEQGGSLEELWPWLLRAKDPGQNREGVPLRFEGPEIGNQ